MKEVLLLYSGGKDSLLSAYYLMEQGYHVNLIHYDNCSMIGTENIKRGAELLEKRFGKDKITYLGVAPVISEIRSLKKLENIPFSEIIKEYGDITFSQYQCLICRCAMYCYSAMIAENSDIKYIAEGARKSQLFAIEQPTMIERYKKFLNRYGLELLTPVYDLTDDLHKENVLLQAGIWDCSCESKCMLGYPLKEELSESIIKGIENIYDKVIEPEMDRLMNRETEKKVVKSLVKSLDKDYVHWY